MAKNFQELRARMSDAARAASAAEHSRLLEEMSLQAASADLEIRAVFPDGRAVKITQFSE
jgi:hypothetical protein